MPRGAPKTGEVSYIWCIRQSAQHLDRYIRSGDTLIKFSCSLPPGQCKSPAEIPVQGITSIPGAYHRALTKLERQSIITVTLSPELYVRLMDQVKKQKTTIDQFVAWGLTDLFDASEEGAEEEEE